MIREVNSVIDGINEDLVSKAAIRTRGASGKPGLDADEWCRFLGVTRFGTASNDLRKAIAVMTKVFVVTK